MFHHCISLLKAEPVRYGHGMQEAVQINESLENDCVGTKTILIAVFVVIGVLMFACVATCCACGICLPQYRMRQAMRKAQQPQQPGEYDINDKC